MRRKSGFVVLLILIELSMLGCNDTDKDLILKNKEKGIEINRNESYKPNEVQDEDVVFESIDDGLHIEKIADGTFVVNHEFPWASNSMVVVMNNSDIILIDTPNTPEATKMLLDWMNNKFGKRKLVAINTGFHFDNLGGNQTLIEDGIPIYGSTLTVDLIEEYGEDSRDLMLKWLDKPESKIFYDTYKTIPYIAPTNLFDLDESDMVIEIEALSKYDQEIEIYYPGESHSKDNLVVNFPQKNILFGGCMIKSLESINLGNIADANLDEWPKSVKKVLDKYEYSTEIVMPGHGDIGNLDLIRHTIELGK